MPPLPDSGQAAGDRAGNPSGNPFRRRPPPPSAAQPAPPAPPPPVPADPPRRRAGRWVAGVLLGLVLLLGLAAWKGPGLLDWDAWRPQIAEIASTRLGRPVALGGRVTLALLPQPRIEAADVTLGDEGDGLRVDAQALRLRLDLAALVAGRLEPREIAILGGEIRLPWPPVDLPSFRPPSWLGALDARLEDCRVSIGGLTVEGVNARLVTGGVTEALVADGSFTWRGQPVRFNGQLGRAGYDGAAPLDLAMAAANATASARGVLAAGGGFEGRMEAAGPDLSALLPAPAVAFRAAGRLKATEEVIAGVDLGLELGGQAGRGAVALRLLPEPRLDVALNTGRLDLDTWIAAVRQRMATAGLRAIPLGIDLSAEAATLWGVPLRRLRGGFFLDGERLALSDVSAVLPGEAEVELNGASAGQRLEMALQFTAANLRETLAGMGVALDGVAGPGRLRQAEGRLRLALQDGQGTLSDLAMELDGAKITGNGVVRPGPRPSIGLGLAVDRLDLDGLLSPDWHALPARLGGFDLNLRLAADQVRMAGAAPIRRAALDATLEKGRLALRRLGFRLAELDVALSGSAMLAGGPPGSAVRLSDLVLDIGGNAGAGDGALPALLPPAWLTRLPAQIPVALRLTGGGAPDALALRAEGDMGELRLEAQGTLDAQARRGTAAVTLRHPGAPRLLAPLLGETQDRLAAWLGQGSFALIGTLTGSSQGVALDRFDLVAAGLRAQGGLALALTEVRPRLTGQLVAESLPLPDPLAPDATPMPWQRLAGFDAELAVQAGEVVLGGRPSLAEAQGRLLLGSGTLKLEAVQGRLAGGALEGTLAVDFAEPDAPPRFTLEASLADAMLEAPLLGLPVDLAGGQLSATARLQAEGHGRSGISATLGGTLELSATDGQLAGYDLAAVRDAAALPAFAAAEAALRRALAAAEGSTAFTRLEVAARLADGVATLERATLAGEAGAATGEGRVDLARGTLDLLLTATPVDGAAPIGLRLSGPSAAPRRQPELAPFLRWKAEQG